jgi:ABC-type multidrug transport system fused ATPase/permease subunit
MHILRRLLGYLQPYRRQAVLTYLCLLMVTVLNLIVPWLVKSVIDYALAQGTALGNSRSYLVQAALAIIGISMVKAVFSFGQRYLTEWLSLRTAYDIRNQFYNHVQRLSFAYHDAAQTGQLMSRATSDVDMVRQFIGSGLMEAANILLLLASTLFILFGLDWRLTLVALIPIPPLAFVAVRFGRVIRPHFQGIQAQVARLSTRIQESMAGVRVVKAFAREPYESERFAAENANLMDRRLRVMRLWGLNFPLMSFLIGLSTIIILWYGGREVIAGRLTIGSLVAFNGYLMMLAWPVQRLGWMVDVISRALASGERLFEILDAPSPVREATDARVLPPVQGEVRFENVSFSYADSRPVLHEVSLEAKPGQIIALLGATGSGKSTIISLIPRFYGVSAGRITIDGVDIREVTLKSLRQQIGMVLQESFLFSATIRDNIAYGCPDATLEEIIEAAKVARAHDFISEFPDGYETWVGERGVTVSGGQKQRLAIARAVLLDPRIIILDDSTSSVDTNTEYEIQQALGALMKGRTTFVIAQRLTTVLHADQIIVLDKGRVAERGTHQELLAANGIYREIYDLQLRDQEDARRREIQRVQAREELELQLQLAQARQRASREAFAPGGSGGG